MSMGDLLDDTRYSSGSMCQVALEKASSGEAMDNTNGSDQVISADVLDLIRVSNQIIYPLIASVGIVLNGLSLVALVRSCYDCKMMRQKTTTLQTYLCVLAVSNLCIMALYLPFLDDPTLHDQVDPQWTRGQVIYHCFVQVPLLNAAMAFSIYIMISMSVERFICVYRPQLFRRVHSGGVACAALVASFIVAVACQVPFLFKCQVRCANDTDYERCYWIEDAGVTSAASWIALSWMSTIVARLGPCIVLTVLNVSIIVRLKKIVLKRQRMTNCPCTVTEAVTAAAAATATTSAGNADRFASSPLDGVSAERFASAPLDGASAAKHEQHDADEMSVYLILSVMIVFFVLCLIPSACALMAYRETFLNDYSVQMFRITANALELSNYAVILLLCSLSSHQIRKQFSIILTCNHARNSWLVTAR